MGEKTLLIIALIGTILGLFGLLVFSETADFKEISLGSIDGEKVGSDVKVFGTISSLRESNQSIILTITQPEELQVILYMKKKGNIPLKPGDIVEVLGEVDEFNGHQQVFAQRIRVVR